MKKYIVVAFLSLIFLNACSKKFDEMTANSELKISNHSISDFPNIWWQWAFSIPDQISPVRDLNGSNCHQGQSGDVWFLAGGYGTSKIKRKCVVPSNKFIFFPVINMVYYKPRNGILSCDDAKKYAALNNDKLISIDVELDSIKSTNPANARLSSENCFNIFELSEKSMGNYDAYPSASDGYWIMLKPLSKGNHTLKFQAQYNRENGAFSKMAQDIEYELEVK